jgi:prophage DNA circulation protein
MSDETLDELTRQLQNLIQYRIEDIRADVRAAQARVSGLVNHAALTVGDAAALIEIRRILADVEKRLETLQIERGRRYSP